MNVLYNNHIVHQNKCSINKYWNIRSLGLHKRLAKEKWIDAKRHAHILHWTGPIKPWLKTRRISRFYHADFWIQYLPLNFNNCTIQHCYKNWWGEVCA
eukprot:37814_1